MKMITELEILYRRLDEMRMTEADRHVAKIQLARAEALIGLCAAAARFIRGRSARALRSPGLPAQASS
jgi:sulfopyruvate decarboxylase TPP-binding subunit